MVQKYAYDPWGARRNPDDWTQKDSRTSWITNRGYTGHEHLDAFGVINMNGRVYDPLTAQFLSPDPELQAPGDWLNYNRYSYCFGNPMRYVDPSGCMTEEEKRNIEAQNSLAYYQAEIRRGMAAWYQAKYSMDQAIYDFNQYQAQVARDRLENTKYMLEHGYGSAWCPELLTAHFGSEEMKMVQSGYTVTSVWLYGVNYVAFSKGSFNFIQRAGGGVDCDNPSTYIIKTSLWNATSGGAENGAGGGMSDFGKANAIAGLMFSAMEYTPGSFRIAKGSALSLHYYASGWTGGSRARITTYNIGKIGKGLGVAGAILGTVVDGIGVYNWTQNPNSENAVSPGKFTLNAGMTAYGIWVNPIAPLVYSLVDAYYPGGWPGYFQDSYDLNQSTHATDNPYTPNFNFPHGL